MTTLNTTAGGTRELSDYEKSPFGAPLALLQGQVRVAVLARCSTEDNQDPRQSIMRQVGNARGAKPEAWLIVGYFYDVESGRLELSSRGRADNTHRFDIPVPREGGLDDLLAEAAHPGRRFDVVLCDSVSRVARRMFEGVSVERALERAGVPLFAANEPINISGQRSQQLLQRRINQSVAEWEVQNTLELSWGGLCVHVKDGWNIGKPPYGYTAAPVRHPNSAKAERGAVKNRLEPDGIRAQTVTQIGLWRYHEQIGYGHIADRLNADPTRYPPPTPTSLVRARGAWGKTSVMEILRNPKYTGYQVFNRRASRSGHGRVNDPRKWVWSPELVHEPLIPKWMFDELTTRRAANRGSRSADGPRDHPSTRRTYVLRSMLFCQCGRRMHGAERRGIAYYQCWPKNNNRGRPDKYEGHPATVYVGERALLEQIAAFYSERVFGPERAALIAADLSGIDDRATRARATERARLRRQLADIARRQDSLLLQAQNGDPQDPFTLALRGNYNELEARKRPLHTQLDDLDTADREDPHHTAAANVDNLALLDALPYLRLNLADAPDEHLRSLFTATQLTVRLEPHPADASAETGDPRGGYLAQISITLPADDTPTLAAITASAAALGDPLHPQPDPPDHAPPPPATSRASIPTSSDDHHAAAREPLQPALRLSVTTHLPRRRTMPC